VDQSTELPEGTVLEFVLDDGGDELDTAEREALDAAICRSLEQADRGETSPVEMVLEQLRKRSGE